MFVDYHKGMVRINITRDDFEAYEAIRQSGLCNMFDYNAYKDASGLSREKAIAIMENYGKLKKAFEGDKK